jgi:hypothetical protein
MGMAQFASVIPNYAIASGLPSDWTQETGTFTSQVVADATTSGVTDRILNTSADTVSGQITWNTPGSITNQESLGLIKLTGPTANTTSYGVASVRQQAGAVSAYSVMLVSDSSGGGGATFSINLLNAGVATPLTTGNFTWTTGSWYWGRIRVSGTALNAKVWALGTPEPVGFILSANDATWASGKVGTRMATIGTNIAFFSAASGTDSAPSVPGIMVVPR